MTKPMTQRRKIEKSSSGNVTAYVRASVRGEREEAGGEMERGEGKRAPLGSRGFCRSRIGRAGRTSYGCSTPHIARRTFSPLERRVNGADIIPGAHFRLFHFFFSLFFDVSNNTQTQAKKEKSGEEKNEESGDERDEGRKNERERKMCHAQTDHTLCL